MAEGDAPATGAEATTTPAAAGDSSGARVATPPDRYQEAATKLGLKNSEQLIEAAQLYVHALTPEGQQNIIERVKAAVGKQIAREVIENDPDAILADADSKLRRKVRRAVARRDAESKEDEGAEGTDEQPAKVKDPGKDLEALRAEMNGRMDATEKAVILAPRLHSLAAKDPRIAANFDAWSREVTSLLATNHPKYQGEDGIAKASDDTLSRWRRMGEAAGLTAPAAPSPKQGGGQTVDAPEEISKLVQKAMAQRRGRGSSARDDQFAEIRAKVFGE